MRFSYPCPRRLPVNNNFHVHARRDDMSIKPYGSRSQIDCFVFSPAATCTRVQRRQIILLRQTYKARPLQRGRGGAQHSQTYVIVDDAGTLEV